MDPSVNLKYFSHPQVVLDYARAAVNVGLWNSEKILFEKFISRDAETLELGCGAGRVALGLARLGYKKITATDFAPPMVETAREVCAREREKIRFAVADASALEFPDAAFDAVIFAFNGLQMIPRRERRERALREIFRVLRPGGIFIFTGHDRGVPARREHWTQEKNRWENRSRDPALDDFGDWNHATPQGAMFIHSADAEEMRAVLEKIGFEVIFSEMRSCICAEPEAVRDFSDDTRFWVVGKLGIRN